MESKIKFRVWDTKSHTMLNWFALMQEAFNRDGVSLVYKVLTGFHDNLVVQCWTGLYDKNEKPIYEGDILKCLIKEKWTSDDVTETTQVVAYTYRKSGESDSSGFLNIPEDREVIGNIYQNPELIKKLTHDYPK